MTRFANKIGTTWAPRPGKYYSQRYLRIMYKLQKNGAIRPKAFDGVILRNKNGEYHFIGINFNMEAFIESLREMRRVILKAVQILSEVEWDKILFGDPDAPSYDMPVYGESPMMKVYESLLTKEYIQEQIKERHAREKEILGTRRPPAGLLPFSTTRPPEKQKEENTK